jgi:hypothetical protein
MARSYRRMAYQKKCKSTAARDLAMRFVLPGIMIAEEERF